MTSIIIKCSTDLPRNAFFLKHLEKWTYYDYQLIVIAEANDESSQLYKLSGATIIPCYHGITPYECYQIAISKAIHPIIAFLTPSLIVSPAWDRKIHQLLESKEDCVVSCSTNLSVSRKSYPLQSLKWRLLPNLINKILGSCYTSDHLNHWLLYPSWSGFNHKLWRKNGLDSAPGFLYSNLICYRSLLKNLPATSNIGSPIVAISHHLSEYFKSKQAANSFLIAKGIFLHELNGVAHAKAISGIKPKPAVTDSEILAPVN